MAKEILVADSDQGDQEAFRRIYETTDYELVFTENGEDALLRIKLFKPDLIIAGTGLREKDGLELCETIKTDPEFKHIPFLLVTEMFDEVSEKDRARVKADGIISKPLREGEILSLTDQLMEDVRDDKVGKEIMNQEKGWTVLPEKVKRGDDQKEDFNLDEIDEDNEEIIELVEVVEEPEPKMSIDDFVSTGKAESVGDIPPLDSWDKLFGEEQKPEEIPGEEKPLEEKRREKKPSEEAFEFILEGEKDAGPGVDLKAERETSPDEELFEKIELEEILEKVERLQPAIEKEWPGDQEIEKRIKEALPTPEEEKKWLDLEGFESALKAEVKEEKKAAPAEPIEKELQPLFFEEPLTLSESKEDVSLELAPPVVEMVEEESFVNLDDEELAGGIVEEELGEDEISVIGELLEGKEGHNDIIQEVGLPGFGEEAPSESVMQEVPSESILDEAEISSLFQEAKAPGSPEEVDIESFIQEIQAPIPSKEVEALRPGQDIQTPGPPKEFEIESFIQEIEAPIPSKEIEALSPVQDIQAPIASKDFEIESFIQEIQAPIPSKEVEALSLVQDIQAPIASKDFEIESFIQEIQAPIPSKEVEALSLVQDIQTPSLREMEAPEALLEEVHPAARMLDRQIGELIGKGVQEMIEGFVTRVLPGMTQNIINLTLERIETVVKEVVPNLAEKAIQEEIKRLQKGDKD